jgi:hypothetical protein
VSNVFSSLPLSFFPFPLPLPDEPLDTDNPEHITWLYDKARARAAHFNIPGVTYALTQGVVKNIIPAIASTNAVVAASCCNEAFKIASGASTYLNNYMMYSGDDGVYTYTFEHQRKDDCPVCGNLARPLALQREWTLQDLIDKLGGLTEAYVPFSSFSFLALPLLKKKAPLLFPQPPTDSDSKLIVPFFFFFFFIFLLRPTPIIPPIMFYLLVKFGKEKIFT